VCIVPSEEDIIKVSIVELPLIRIRRAICGRWILVFQANAVHESTITVRVQQLLDNDAASASTRPSLFEIAEELDAFLNFKKNVAIMKRWAQADSGQLVDDCEARSL
jgi:hypothetical protein